MSERKAINKWYPPDYDPSKIPKRAKKNANQPIKIRMMAPYSMRCLKCDEYIGARRSFNARKEITNEKYLNIKIIRFYITCPGCNNTITFKTDPKNAGYTPKKVLSETTKRPNLQKLRTTYLQDCRKKRKKTKSITSSRPSVRRTHFGTNRLWAWKISNSD